MIKVETAKAVKYTNCTPDIIYTELAQLEERGPYKADVMGSSPLLRTIKDPYSKIFSQNCKFWMKFLSGLVICASGVMVNTLV